MGLGPWFANHIVTQIRARPPPRRARADSSTGQALRIPEVISERRRRADDGAAGLGAAARRVGARVPVLGSGVVCHVAAAAVGAVRDSWSIGRCLPAWVLRQQIDAPRQRWRTRSTGLCWGIWSCRRRKPGAQTSTAQGQHLAAVSIQERAMDLLIDCVLDLEDGNGSLLMGQWSLAMSILTSSSTLVISSRWDTQR
jgi:hypothetical protein